MGNRPVRECVSVSARRGNRWLWNYGGLWIVGSNRKADILPKPDMCKMSIYNCLQLFIITRQTSWLQGNQYREVNPEGYKLVLVMKATQCLRFDWKFINLIRVPARKEMSRCPPKETRLVIFRFPDAAAQYSQHLWEDMDFQKSFPGEWVCWGMEMALKLL